MSTSSPISNIICFSAGKTGCGKSYSLSYILEKEYEKKRRGGMVIVDFRDDHLKLLKKGGFKYLRISHDILRNYKIDWSGIIKKYPYLIITPYKLSRDEYEELVDDIAGGLVDVGNRIYVVEEAQLAFPVHGSIKRNISVLATTGRRIGLDLYFTSQRPALVNSIVVSQANIRISFAVDDVNDISRMKTYFSNEHKLEKLQRFEFVIKNTMNHKELKGTTNDLKVIDDVIWGE